MLLEFIRQSNLLVLQLVCLLVFLSASMCSCSLSRDQTNTSVFRAKKKNYIIILLLTKTLCTSSHAHAAGLTKRNPLIFSSFRNTSSDDSSFMPSNKQRKFIVFESLLLELFAICIACHTTSITTSVISVVGTMVIVEQACKTCGNRWRWTSQPKVGEIPAGNLLLSSAIFFSGALPRKTLRVLSFMGMAAISLGTFFRHQAKYLHHTVMRVWKATQQNLLSDLQGGDLVLGGDGRNDSMGHCAKYGTYTLMDLQDNKIININTVQVVCFLRLSALYAWSVVTFLTTPVESDKN